MAITTAMCNSFKKELLQGLHDMDGHTFKIALIKASPTGTFGAATTNYSDLSTDEASGTGYTAGGQTLGGVTVALDGSTAYVDFDNEVFTSATISADGCLIYNTSATNKAVAVFDFGQTVSSTSGDFTVVFPTPDGSNAVIRIS